MSDNRKSKYIVYNGTQLDLRKLYTSINALKDSTLGDKYYISEVETIEDAEEVLAQIGYEYNCFKKETSAFRFYILFLIIFIGNLAAAFIFK